MEGGLSEELSIEDCRRLPPAVAAKNYDERVRFLDRAHKRTFVELGLIMMEMEDRELFRELGFQSLNRWICAAAPMSKGNCYQALGAMRAVRDEIPLADLQAISRRNITILGKLSSGVRSDRVVLDAAKSLTEDHFVNYIKHCFPEQHIEQRQALNLSPREGASQAILGAFAAAMWCYDLQTQEEALEAISQFFMESLCEREGFAFKSNREAYENRSQDPA
jgi:hypothetical protein